MASNVLPGAAATALPSSWVGPRQAWGGCATPARGSAFGVPPKLISPNAGTLYSHQDCEVVCPNPDSWRANFASGSTVASPGGAFF
jgi:hypothetical protein